jgi:hypothetical protein
MLTIEQSQAIADLRQRMLNNIAAGKPAHSDISEEELRNSLGWLRQNRATAGSKGGTAKATKGKSSKEPGDGPVSDEAKASLASKLANLGLDLD